MKKTILAMATTIGVYSGATLAADWRVLPVTESDYKGDVTLSIIGGMADGDHAAANQHSTDHAIGAEASFRCILLQSPNNNLRQQFSYVNIEKSHNIELNPHLVYDIAPKLQFGAGPGLGVAIGETETTFGAQFGASIHYRGLGPVFLGGEGRYQIQFGDHAHNNWRALMKVGYNFF